MKPLFLLLSLSFCVMVGFGQNKLVGTYRCWQFNVSGGGGSCRFAPLLVLKENREYTMSSEKGTYKVNGNTLKLSNSKIRGNGIISSDERTIRFEYVYKGLHHTVTYLRFGD